MSSSSVIFEFKPKKIVFKPQTTSVNSLQFNLFYNNKKISNTEPLQVSEDVKEFDLTGLESLSFDTKDETNKYPISVFILYGQKSPAPKIIFKRSQMMKKYELQKIDEFKYQDDFGWFSIFYEIKIKNNLEQNSELLGSSNQLQNKNSKESPSRNFKRPTSIQIGAKAEKIRKSSYQVKDSSESPAKNDSNMNVTITKSQPKNLQSQVKSIPNLTLEKQNEEEQKLIKKDVKINLFETFNPKQNKENHHHQVKSRNIHQNQVTSHNNKPHRYQSNQNHGTEKLQHSKIHSAHEHSGHDHHDSHDSHNHNDDHHGHQESHSLSFKLKTVIFMLIVGFIFLMYDALDDRFSRKILKKESIVHHGHQDLHHGHGKKKKNSKKQKKAVAH